MLVVISARKRPRRVHPRILYYIILCARISLGPESTKGFTADTGNGINKYKTFRPQKKILKINRL